MDRRKIRVKLVILVHYAKLVPILMKYMLKEEYIVKRVMKNTLKPWFWLLFILSLYYFIHYWSSIHNNNYSIINFKISKNLNFPYEKDSDINKNNKAVEESAYLKILLNYFQLLNLQMIINIDWGDAFSKFQFASQTLSGSFFKIVSLECIADSPKINYNIFIYYFDF